MSAIFIGGGAAEEPAKRSTRQLLPQLSRRLAAAAAFLGITLVTAAGVIQREVQSNRYPSGIVSRHA